MKCNIEKCENLTGEDLCEDCKTELIELLKPDVSKIKKVVMPETEVKIVCELGEENFINRYNHVFNSISLERNEFKSVKTQKPLADDEVSVEEFLKEKIPRFWGDLYIFQQEELFVLTKDFSTDGIVFSYFFRNIRGKQYGIRYGSNRLKELLEDLLKDTDIYYIQDQETLFQWCLDQARRAKGE